MFIELLGKILYYKNHYVYRVTWQIIIDRQVFFFFFGNIEMIDNKIMLIDDKITSIMT